MRTALLLALVLLLPVDAAAVTVVLDFDLDSGGAAIAHGDVITNQYAGDGVTVSAVNPNRPFDDAMAFDSTETGTLDPDLQDPWDGGNLPSNTLLNNLLIISERENGPPDDEGNRPAGELIFDFFDVDMVSIGFDLVDIEGTDPSDEPGGVDLYLAGLIVGTFEFMDLITNGTPVFDPTVAFGNNTANRISPISVSSVGTGTGFDRAVFRMGGSGAIDNLIVESASGNTPEPAGFSLLALSLAGLMRFRRRL